MSTLQSGCILILDDEGEWADGLLETLAEQGYETVVAASSADALERLSERGLDMLLTSFTVPKLMAFA